MGSKTSMNDINKAMRPSHSPGSSLISQSKWKWKWNCTCTYRVQSESWSQWVNVTLRFRFDPSFSLGLR